MDLLAYVKIDEFEEVMKNNGIEVPRLRGLRLMSEEKPIYDYIPEDLEYDVLKYWVASDFGKDKYGYTFSSWTDEMTDYLTYPAYKDDDGNEVRKIDWKKLRRKEKKYLKLKIKHRIREIKEQYEMFNKYCGRDDVLYIHARIGGLNWSDYGGNELRKQPWFLDKVDDSFDGTYCDIYAKIEPIKEEETKPKTCE